MNLAAVGCSDRCRSMARLASIVGVPFAFEDSRVKARASASSCASASANGALFNGAWLITERQLAHEGWSWGFRSNFYAGSDAAMLRPLNGFGPEAVHLETTFATLLVPAPAVALQGRSRRPILGRQMSRRVRGLTLDSSS